MSLDRKAMTERGWQTSITAALTEAGYIWNEVRRMQTRDGRWLTGNSLKGLPDVQAIGRGHQLWIECKTARGSVDFAQLALLDALAAALPVNRCWILRPTDDLAVIAEWIVLPGAAPRRYGWSTLSTEAAMSNTTGKTAKR